ncbi:unnamed protein product [Caenorhabditis angaria]|uniref:Thioesterase domain-containing protein n=1 Tax=Caenorhabditis angaria TaxID=860376 RepID=A0A9P1N0F8_9PELO|nr:unnamed protein product [Caenorhabditis angaria]
MSTQNGNGILENDTVELAKIVHVFKNLKSLENFNRNGGDVVPIFVSKEKLVCEMLIQAQHLNSKGTLHGGQTATLTDIITARAAGVTIKDKGMASVELAVSYMLPVKVGDTIEITANVLKIGRNMVFTDCDFRRKSDGKLTAKGKHTIAILPDLPGVDLDNGKQF